MFAPNQKFQVHQALQNAKYAIETNQPAQAFSFVREAANALGCGYPFDQIVKPSAAVEYLFIALMIQILESTS